MSHVGRGQWQAQHLSRGGNGQISGVDQAMAPSMCPAQLAATPGDDLVNGYPGDVAEQPVGFSPFVGIRSPLVTSMRLISEHEGLVRSNSR